MRIFLKVSVWMFTGLGLEDGREKPSNPITKNDIIICKYCIAQTMFEVPDGKEKKKE